MDDLDNLGARLRRLELGIADIQPFQTRSGPDDDYRIDPVQTLTAASTNIAAKLTKIVITWISVEDAKVAGYEIWVSRIANGVDQPYLAATVEDSPATFNITSTAAGNAMAYIRTVMKNGLKLPLTASPSVVFQVF